MANAQRGRAALALRHKPTTMTLAKLETRSFDFRGVFTSPAAARRAFAAAWDRHQQQTGATLTWKELADDLSCLDVTVGVVYRDDSQLWPEVK